MNRLKDYYLSHLGKVTDKWNLYLHVYDDILVRYRRTPVNLLEIGVQNGGSLEIWAKYFDAGKVFVGCDINQRCAELFYDDPRISLIIGNANDNLICKKIFSIADGYNIIIDDGSHKSSDIICAFLKYFQILKDDGIYIIEDLHCSYWSDFEGGLYNPYSSISFLKRMVDVVNLEHWGLSKSISDFLNEYASHVGIDIESLNFDEFKKISSIKFYNSMCIVEKKSREYVLLGERHIVGVHENVFPGLKGYKNLYSNINQNYNKWSNLVKAPDLEYESIKQSNFELKKEIDQIYASRAWRFSRLLSRAWHFCKKRWG